MAIQFKCPACDAMIRVPDTSAGKKGTCPQCREKLIVPTVAQGTTATVARPAAAPAPASGALPAELPHVGMPHIDVTGKRSNGPSASVAAPQLEDSGVHPSAAAGSIPAFGLPSLDDDAAPSLAHQLSLKERQQKKKRKMAWVGPAVCGVILLGVLAGFYWMSQPKLEGDLTAHIVPGMETRPALIPGHVSGLSKADLTEVLRRLKSNPAEWSSNSSRIKMSGADDGIEVTLRAGSGSELVSVQIMQNKAMVNYVKQHGDALDKPRLATIQKNAPKLFDNWLSHFTQNVPMTDQTAHRDGVIFPSLVTGVGFHLEASVKGTRYPAVYEDSDGGIYFLLPNGTKTFSLHGRKLAGGGTFPANFTVHVEGTTEAPASAKKKVLPKTREEREQENQGMNPELYQEKKPKSDMSAPDSEADAIKGGLGNLLAPGSRPSNTKPKSAREKKMEMMNDAEMPDDAMPGKPKPKTKN